MSSEAKSKTLVKVADAAGYAMAAREEDLLDWAILQPEVALRNGHSSAARAVRQMAIPFARLADIVNHLFALSDVSRVPPGRPMLTSR